MRIHGAIVGGNKSHRRYARIPELPELTAPENALVQEMLEQLRQHEERNYIRNMFFNAEQEFENMGIAIPEQFEQFATILGWNATAVNTLARRIKLDGFVAPGSPDRFEDLDYALNGAQFYRHLKMTIQSALIYGVAFIAVIPGLRAAQVQGLSARDATGIWDDNSPNDLRAGLAILDWGVAGIARAIVFFPGQLITITRADGSIRWDVARIQTPSRSVGLVPFTFLPQLDKHWGASRITRPMMNLTQAAARAFLRGEMNGEVYGFPQLYATNLDPEVAADFRTGFGRFFAVDYERNDEGEPVEGAPETRIGQVQVGQQTPHLDQMRSIAMMYAAETNLSPDKLGVIHDNPSSADAIDRADGELNDLAEETTRDFDYPTKKVLEKIWSASNRTNDVPLSIQQLRTDWADPGITTRYSQRMALASLTTAGLVVPGEEVSYEAAGFSRATAARLAAAWHEKERREAMKEISAQALAARSNEVTRAVLDSQRVGR